MKRQHTPRAAVTACLVAGGYTRHARPFRVKLNPYNGRVVIVADTPGHLRQLHAHLLHYYPTQLVADWHWPRLEVQL
jgi:hypothetical protein